MRLGSDRLPDEGLRIGTVRRPPRGVPRDQYARGNWYDVWYPLLAPTPETIALAQTAVGERELRAFARRYRKEMQAPECARTLDLLAALSHTSNFSVGCYCADETRCHRAILRELLRARGARVA